MVEMDGGRRPFLLLRKSVALNPFRRFGQHREVRVTGDRQQSLAL